MTRRGDHEDQAAGRAPHLFITVLLSVTTRLIHSIISSPLSIGRILRTVAMPTATSTKRVKVLDLVHAFTLPLTVLRTHASLVLSSSAPKPGPSHLQPDLPILQSITLKAGASTSAHLLANLF
jgi:hypothetical protein